ncbi:MAG: ATP-binding protein, partial [Bacteroidales bacterium]|nr:ATP-binding protein [Bacteroidales bacterium]
IGNKAQGKIDIKLKLEHDNVIISITDNGKGMNKAEQKRVFTPNFTTKSSGMGIGLSIVNQIIMSANGTISFKSEEGKGTNFLITLPLDKRKHGQITTKS